MDVLWFVRLKSLIYSRLLPLTKNGVTQRFFTKNMLYYNYFFAVPLCGTSPSNTAFNWTQASVFQQVLSTEEIIELGFYNSSSQIWTMGSCDSATTLQTTVFGGTYCPWNGRNRQTTIYLTCDERYNARYPSISVSEMSSCVCESFPHLHFFVS
jgi:hypothetical protein